MWCILSLKNSGSFACFCFGRGENSITQDERKRTYKGFHKVTCPCCQNEAVIYGKESITSHDRIEDEIVEVRKDVTANLFLCDVCKLKLTTYAELKCAGLPLHYTNIYQYDPTEYFDIDISALQEAGYMEEYSNE